MNHCPTKRWKPLRHCLFAWIACMATLSAHADGPAVLGDLDALSPEKLTKEQLNQLMPSAKMSRIAPTGSTNTWTNEIDGTLIASTNNKAGLGSGSIASARSYSFPGTWRISEDGRYCLIIKWSSIPDENWCRFVFRTAQGYFAAKSDQNKADKVYKLVINGS
jgi:hypothetical protein